jgi:hypothetical protein
MTTLQRTTLGMKVLREWQSSPLHALSYRGRKLDASRANQIAVWCS